MDSGVEISWFSGEFDFVPDFFKHIRGENIGNFLMFLPFGFIYPLSQTNPTWKKIIAAGILTVVAIEVFQPILGRAFDINDIILNSLGVIVSTSIFWGAKKIVKLI